MKLTSILLFSITVLLSACRQSNYSATDHPEFQNKALPQAQRLIDSNKIQQGLSYIDSSFRQLKKPGFGDKLAAQNLKAKTLFYYGSGNSPVDSALKYADSAYRFVIQNQLADRYQKEFISLLFVRGNILINRKKYEDAYVNYYQAQLLLDSADMSCELSDYYGRLALIYYRQGKFNNASLLFKKSVENIKKCPENFASFVLTQGSLDNAGLSFLQLKMLDSAMRYFKKAQIFVDQKSRQYASNKIFIAESKGVILQNIGDTYYEMFDFVQAEKYYLESIEISKRDYKSNPIAMQSEIRLAKLYVETSKLNLANQHLKSAAIMLYDNTLDPATRNKAQLFWNKTKLDYFIARKLPDSVAIMSARYLQMQKEMANQEKVFLDVDVTEKFYNLQKDYELDILKKQNELNKLYFISFIILLVAAAVILYLMYKYAKRAKSHNQKLTELNRQITEQNLNLQNALDILEQSQIRYQEVQNVVMHDLRSPITGIALLAEHLLTSDNLTDDEKHMIELMKTSSEDSLKFVNDLLNDGSAPMELEKELVELDKLLNYCVNLLKYKASEKNQKITFSSEPVQFMLNREKIYRVLSNIITNAIKFSPPETEIKVNLKVIEGRSVITIEDHGIGIPDDMKKNIFNLQENVKREGTSGEKSYGIGLITSRKIVEAHAGKIWFESSINKGSTFFIELPFSQQFMVAK
ncbi:ATP-binding protein [Pedobacter sp.]|uniref:ATP-binding protein n=1 Tax=Pedobacter sp. TaxID=1411316 RepID=UPI003BADB1DD